MALLATRTRARSRSRRHTPVELAIAFALGGSLLAVAVPTFLREVHESRFVEPVEGLGRIGAAAIAYAVAHPPSSVASQAVGSVMPAAPAPSPAAQGGALAGASSAATVAASAASAAAATAAALAATSVFPPGAPLTPATPPRGRCAIDPPGTWDHGTWALLDFQPSPTGAPHCFAFAFESGGTPSRATFRADAHGDLDGDGITSTFEVTGHAFEGDPAGPTLESGMYVDSEVE